MRPCIRVRPGPSSLWIAVAAGILAACSGLVTQYVTSVAPSPELGHPLIDARRCLETLGFDMKIIDLDAGLVSGEKFELADDRLPTVVVNEISVISRESRVEIIARSRRTSSAAGGWKSVRTSERARYAVDQLADRLAGGRSGARSRCDSVRTCEGHAVAWTVRNVRD